MKTVLVTGATDGIGLEAAKRLAAHGHHLLLHGRNPAKVEDAERAVRAVQGGGPVESFLADLSRLAAVDELADAVIGSHRTLDVLINNAGVFRTADTVSPDGLDIRFAVNTIAPYLLTQRLLPLLGSSGRVINLSSRAQAPVDTRALAGRLQLEAMDAYAQSKLALTMWTIDLAAKLGGDGPAIIAVNPGSLLATKMVKEGFGVDGSDIGIGADIVVRAALSDEFSTASGTYFDNDAGRFAPPHADALDTPKVAEVVHHIQAILDALA
jgi:NAD(P)-dependent dehydrogenase (short-subunit alcohol dehydrogenase family)